MATYFSNLSYNQDSSLPTSYPVPGDQKFVSFSETPSHPGNTAGYPNQASSDGSYSEILSRNSASSHNFVGMPYGKGRNEMAFIPPASDTVSLQSVDEQSNTGTGSIMGDPQVTPTTEAGFINGERNFQFHGLSLSLGTQVTSAVSGPSFQYQYPNMGFSSLLGTHLPFNGKETMGCEVDLSNQRRELGNSECLPSGFTGSNHNSIETEAFGDPQCAMSHKEMHPGTYQYVSTGYANMLLGSKYLKATQQLLDEVVNVRQALKQSDLDKRQSSHGIGFDDSKENGMSSDPNKSMNNYSSEVSPTERQDLQNKKTKLLSMLDEVHRRYRQYYHQMQIVVSSFEMVAGCGAAKPYTALALQTISRQFRCLRDAISGQIQVTQRSLGEPDSLPNDQGEVIPRLRYVDQQLRQQRALQQLGVMRQAWRPQRGLPESSVSILRAWLFEHFLHPYPKDSEKIMLARQTGLTRNQVANWFINARVRLWKPMVEDMYKEEFGDVEVNSKSSLENERKAHKDNSSASESRGEELQDTVTSTAANRVYPGQVHELKNDHIPDIEMKRPKENSLSQNDSHADNIADSGKLKFQGDQGPNLVGHNLYPDAIIAPNQNGHSSFVTAAATYGMSELSSFAVGSQVSLALGLRNCERDVFPTSGGNHLGNNIADSSLEPDTVDYHCIDPGNQQDRFVNPHLLHDFVV